MQTSILSLFTTNLGYMLSYLVNTMWICVMSDLGAKGNNITMLRWNLLEANLLILKAFKTLDIFMATFSQMDWSRASFSDALCIGLQAPRKTSALKWDQPIPSLARSWRVQVGPTRGQTFGAGLQVRCIAHRRSLLDSNGTMEPKTNLDCYWLLL
jgi:hypothetical protein